MTELPTAPALSRVGGGASDEAQNFEWFFEANERPLFGTLCLVTGDRWEAEELVQEAFLKVWERWETVKAMNDPAGYLYRTAFNLFWNRMRSALRATRRKLRPELQADAFARVDERADLLAALRKLSPRQRAAVVLLDLLELTSEEAGRLLRVRPVTVRSLASQGRRVIREALGARHG
jgi:RNA polymerase sigma factor (sigma-70 family)